MNVYVDGNLHKNKTKTLQKFSSGESRVDSLHDFVTCGSAVSRISHRGGVVTYIPSATCSGI